MSRLQADLLLVFAAIIWGGAFVAQIDGNQHIGPFLFLGIRFCISAVALVPLALWEMKRPAVKLKRDDFLFIFLIGLFLFGAAALQQVAMQTTTATNGGFLTAPYLAIVPFVAWLLQRTPIRPIVLAACAVSIFGAWLLADHGGPTHWARGDILVLIADILWAFHVVLLSKFIARTHRPLFLSCAQCAVTGILGLICATGLHEPVIGPHIRAAMPSLLYAAIVSGCLAYTIQIFAQRHTPAPEAALIMSTESVFAAISGAFLLNERLTLIGIIGCALILIGAVMTEAGQMARRRKAVAG